MRNVQSASKLEISATRARIDVFTLRFSEPTESRFLQTYANNSLAQVRLSLVLAIFLYCAFGILDYWVIPEVKERTWLIRYGIVVPSMLLCLALSGKTWFLRHFQLLTALYVSMAGLGVIAMTLIAPNPGAYLYHIGLLLVLIFAFTAARLRYTHAIVVCGALLLAYGASLIVRPDIPTMVAVNNGFFMFNGFLLLSFSAYSMERFERRNFQATSTIQKRTTELEHLYGKLVIANNGLVTRTAELEQTLHSLRETQTRLVEVEKLAVVGKLVSGMAHELNTPIGNGITTTSHLMVQFKKLKNDLGTGEFGDRIEKQTDALLIILNSLERAAILVKRLKQIAVRKDQNRRREFCLTEVLNQAVLDFKLHHASPGGGLEVECPKGVALDSYPNAILDMLHHLIDNSLAHAFIHQEGKIRVSAIDLGNSVKISYRDDGCGFDENTRVHIFEPFFKQHHKADHAGLGLHIVSNIVTRLLGGEITSQKGEGAQFLIHIPKTAP